MVTENHAAQQAQAAASSGMEPHENPWNAVCVIGLRVYSKQVDMEISLVKHRKMAEASMLDVGGFMPAGPTTGMTGL
ncbi:hypothetical protein DM02DRAFT_619768 [Periconia macrospinosa]|uniref:Uncharacterized protein n=1 Tax=Periconia macrospinosa TaxID=97972 RepID=A0A2V1D3S3_9PLEO|nr:hypothetical protein DM02DRAFT_619768 [Periconia macrospinosa]